MTARNVREGLNVNTILIAIVLGISGYTLKKVVELGEAQAAMAVRVTNHDRVLDTLDNRVRRNTDDIVNIRVNKGYQP